ncbi:MAG: hypothetical protein Kow00108_20430 [Calditrichia bacterium]
MNKPARRIIEYMTIQILLFCSVIIAQSDSIKTDPLSKQIVKKYFHYSGNFGSYGELYSTTAENKRRPSSTARSSLNMTFTFWKFQVPIELTFSTEEVTYRQSFNRLGINPQWKFIKFRVGDFGGRTSEYTVSGISIRGGGIEIEPSWMRLYFYYGTTQRAIEDPRAQTYAFKRKLIAGKLGFGKKESIYFDINVIKAVDDENSINEPLDSINVNPMENIAVSLEGQLQLFKRKFRLGGELAASVISLNTLADKGEVDDVPSWVDNIYTIRLSSRMDYAVKTDMSINTRPFNLKLTYNRVGPGYMSLGLPYTNNDRVRYMGSANVWLIPSKWSVRMLYNYSYDNLENTKVKTLKHNMVNINTMIRPVPGLSFNVGYNKNTLKNETNLDSLIYWENNIEKKRLLFDTFNDRYIVSANYSYRLMNINQSTAVSFSLQRSEKKNEEASKNPFDANIFTIGQNFMFSSKLTAGLTGTFSGNKVDTLTIKTNTFGVNLGYNPMRFWRNTATFSMQKTGQQKALNYNLTMRFRVTARSNLNLSFYKIDFIDPKNPSREYKEHRGVLTYNYSF